ncbi:photosynthetic complex putative assembly protein PuhB [Ramlibacter sp.]|uniref:photosynthetic complex putative assembly protein PuhB n=1 Tax=Ramlibacter sp. TaxID=1917967 RepID=UPI003D0D57A0
MKPSAAEAASAAHEHEFEATHGLPEALPAGEHILWQGGPDWWALACHAFHVRQLAAYFAAMLALRAAFVVSEGGSAGDAAAAALWLLPLALFALATLVVLARLSARTTVYTLTNRRVVMRVGIVLTLTFNLPLRRLAGAGLREDAATGIGDIPMQLAGREKVAYVHLWPHARPWRAARPEPMLRCIPHVREVAGLLAATWSAETGVTPQPLPAAQVAGEVRTRAEAQLA